ncbi:MAG: hypothetical protein O3C63_05570 [Cyanobacteria bacterium]|nr:hypothetical protein [Cyanobacteriota bacterium]MDA1020203.1 hypothetical protein [Cyanobacteriota bacterium]
MIATLIPDRLRIHLYVTPLLAYNDFIMYTFRNIVIGFLLEIFYSSALVYVNKKQLQYLKEVLNEPDDYWALDKAMQELISSKNVR